MKAKLTLLTLFSMFFSPCSFAGDLAVYGAKLYSAPGVPPLDNATIVISDGIITEVSQRIPSDAVEKIDAKGKAITAGLWNSHVHFTAPALKEDPQHVVTNMLLKYGFTSVVDTGSDLAATRELAQSIDEGKFNGPNIVMASGSFVFTDGTPSYLPGITLPEISEPEQATIAVQQVLDSGAQGIKIFSGSFISPSKTIHLPRKIIKAITQAAHKQRAFVIAHPTDKMGVENAVNGGVDILAHTAPSAGEFHPELISAVVNNQVAVIPTLKLWRWELNRHGLPDALIESTENTALDQLKSIHRAGGTILFGTDVGYMTDYDPSQEYRLMARSGMNFEAVLRSLTTSPAKKFSRHSGKIQEGEPGDLIIYKTDPFIDMAFESVDMTIKNGKVIYKAINAD